MLCRNCSPVLGTLGLVLNMDIGQSFGSRYTFEALSTLIRFQTKTGTVLLRFQKDLRPHLSFSYRFRPSTRRICLKTLLYHQCIWSNELDECAFQYIGPQNWREIEYTRQRLSTILDSHGRVVWRLVMSILMTSPYFSPSTLKNSVFKKHCFQIAPLWRAFSNGSVFGDRLWRCSVDDSRIRSKTAPFSFENGLVWTGPEKHARNLQQAS